MSVVPAQAGHRVPGRLWIAGVLPGFGSCSPDIRRPRRRPRSGPARERRRVAPPSRGTPRSPEMRCPRASVPPGLPAATSLRRNRAATEGNARRPRSASGVSPPEHPPRPRRSPTGPGPDGRRARQCGSRTPVSPSASPSRRRPSLSQVLGRRPPGGPEPPRPPPAAASRHRVRLADRTRTFTPPAPGDRACGATALGTSGVDAARGRSPGRLAGVRQRRRGRGGRRNGQKGRCARRLEARPPRPEPRPPGQHRARPAGPRRGAGGCSPTRARRSTPRPRSAAPCSASLRRWPSP